jgi:ribosome-associated protein
MPITGEKKRPATPLTTRDIAVAAAGAASMKKAGDPVVLDLTGLTVVTDFFVICSGESTTQVRAVSEHIEDELRKAGIKPRGIEGRTFGHWVLLDYGDVIVHVFEKETRVFYDLERLWMDAKTIDADENKSDMGRQDKRTVHP